MTDTNRPPLWLVMDDGMDAQANREVGQTDPLVWRRIRAAEIRAVRDWLVPEEAPPLGPAGKERMTLRALLTTEADRAERGE